MKKSVLSLGVAAAALLTGACDHYSKRLAALDEQFATPPAAITTASVYARNDNTTALNTITPAAGNEGTAAQPFNLALAQAYYDRAVKEKEAMDHSAAHYYTTKAEAALRGETPEPAVPADFGIERSDSEAMMKERTKLLQMIQAYKNTDRQPAVVQAQVDFDGWLDQAAENKTGPALTCREGFIQAMEQLDGTGAETRRYGLFFSPGQQVLSEGAQTIIADVADFVRENPGRSYHISLIEKAPSPVSAQRIAAVQSALTAKGLQQGSVAPAPAAQAAPNGLLASQGAPPTNEAIEVVVAFDGGKAAPVPVIAPVVAPTPAFVPATAPQTLAPAAGVAPTQAAPVQVAPAPAVAPPVQAAPPVRRSTYKPE